MTGAITWEQVAFFVGLSFTIIGAVAGVWWRVEGKITTAKKEATNRADEAKQSAARIADDLAAHKLHVAESYVTKSGLREIKEEILGAVGGIRDDVRHLATRIDTMHEAASKPRPTRRPTE
ncbi:MAG: hypothetical protein H5U22_01785 [Rhizobium sp.]|nr:hypothetical protein [Rhizobium sp.]